MKNILFISILAFFIFSCSSSKFVEHYINKEIEEKCKNNITTLLFDGKSDSSILLRIYSDVDIFTNKKAS